MSSKSVLAQSEYLQKQMHNFQDRKFSIILDCLLQEYLGFRPLDSCHIALSTISIYELDSTPAFLHL